MPSTTLELFSPPCIAAERRADGSTLSEGLRFDGRIAEDFKRGLFTGAVITGHDRAHAAALAWVNQLEARRAFGDDVALDDPRLRERLTEALRRLNAGAGSA